MIYRVKSTVKKVKEGDKYYAYEIQKMELLEDTQDAFGLLNAESGGQLNSNNSITRAKLLKVAKKISSNKGNLNYSKVVDKNGRTIYQGVSSSRRVCGVLRPTGIATRLSV